MKTGSQNFLCTGHLNWRTCGSISSSLSPTRQENAGLPYSRHHWLGSEEHFKEFFMGFQRFKSLALKWSLEDFSTMIQIWMKNGVKKTPLIKRFTTMPIIRAERKLNKTFTSPKKGQVSFTSRMPKILGLISGKNATFSAIGNFPKLSDQRYLILKQISRDWKMSLFMHG